MTRILPKDVADAIGELAALAEQSAYADDHELAYTIHNWLYDEHGMIRYSEGE